MDPYVHGSVTYSHQAMEAAQMSITDEGIKQLWDVYTVEFHSSAKKKKKSLPFATAWVDLENRMLNEINQSEKDKYHVISLICGI